MALLSAKGVCAGYGGADVVHDVHFTVSDGECLCIIGPNGCGKTTLLRALSGLLPARGEILLGSKPLSGMRRREVARHVALLSQITQVYFAYTVYDTVMLGRYLHLKGAFRAPAAADREAVRRCLDTVGLWPQREQPIDTLSGGQLQRVFLARTLAQEPKLILLDEPTNHLDLKHQTVLMQALREWSRGAGRAVVGVLHDLNLALAFADRLMLMQDGRAAALGTPQEVLTPERLRAAFEMDVAAYMKEALRRWDSL
ncbi:MAG: ABC transporter ATP-binding protein [Oscillospiraceae bacterium]|jgi:iron complex transport system ATP-binding protein|nr:ABC transporter ATP-binding protein [Oscillospiraceae bacterium]